MDRQTIDALREAEAPTEKKLMTQQEFDIRAMEIDMELKDLKTEHERLRVEMRAVLLKNRGELLDCIMDNYREKCARRDAEYAEKCRALKEERLELKKKLLESSNSNVCGKTAETKIRCSVMLELDEEDNAIGVRISTLDESFVIALHHIDGGKEYNWDEAMARLKELGKEGFNEKQGKIIAAYHEEIDAALEEAGGDKLGWEWAVGESYANRGWLYFQLCGALYTDSKSNASRVRPLLASEQHN